MSPNTWNIDWRMVYRELQVGVEQELFWYRQECQLWDVPRPPRADALVGVTKALGIEVTWNACILDLDDHVRPTFGGKEPSVVFCDKNTGPGIVGVSAEERERDSCDDLTLRQCLMLNLGIYMMCGKYPGDNAKVLCAGSRTSRGEVPVVFYDGEKHKVHIFEKPVKFKAMELGLYKIVRRILP
jgi:hypothetical protein